MKRGIFQTNKTVEYVSQLEEMTAEERKECAFWERTLKDWQLVRNNPAVKSKVKTDELFVTKMKLEHPEINISTDILYRKYKYLKSGNLKGLIDRRGKALK